MTSARKVSANRTNARGSTGPKSARGRARSARNALRHGLSVTVYSDPVLSKQVDALAHEIAGTDASAEIKELACRVAEAQIDLQRVRCARHQLLIRALSDPYYDTRANMRQKVRYLCGLLQPNAPEVSVAALATVTTSTLKGPLKFAAILSEEAEQLLAMGRYERRALSRRKFAIRLLDEARAESHRIKEEGNMVANVTKDDRQSFGRTKPK